MDLSALGHPERLWLLLALPILYLLSLPPRPKARVLTAHMHQWNLALAKLRRRPLRFRRLRFWLIILATTAAIFAASQPRLPGRPGPNRLIILLDDSASMAAREAGAESAWQRAVTLLQSRLPLLPKQVSVQVVLSSGAEILRGRPEKILAALPTVPNGVSEVSFAHLASDLLSEEQAVWTISDGRDRQSLPEVGALTVVGEDLGNVGLVACEIEDRWPLPEAEISIEVGDFGLNREEVELGISGGGGPSTHRIAIVAGRGVGRLDLTRGPGGMVRIDIEGSDAMVGDNWVQLWLPPPPAPEIALLSGTESSLWLRKAAEVLASESGGHVLGAPSEQAGFALVEGGWLAEPWGRGISFGTGFGESGDLALSRRQEPQVLDWARDDPITRGLDFSDLVIERALDARFLPEGEALLWASDGALMVLAGADGNRSLHCAFELEDTNLPLLPAFPQLLRRAFVRCYGDLGMARINAGSPLSAAESDLRVVDSRPVDRLLPGFGAEGTDLSVPLLLLALVGMACRVYA